MMKARLSGVWVKKAAPPPSDPCGILEYIFSKFRTRLVEPARYRRTRLLLLFALPGAANILLSKFDRVEFIRFFGRTYRARIINNAITCTEIWPPILKESQVWQKWTIMLTQ
jgi:hypothetical protein